MIGVLLADDQLLVRAGFRALLDAQDDIEVVPVTDPGAGAMNFDPNLIHAHIFNEALGEYCHR